MTILRPPRFVLRGLKEFASWLQNQQIEAGLGNPEADGYHLASDADGTRYWEPPPGLNPDDDDEAADAETTRWKIKVIDDDYAPVPGDDRNTLLVSNTATAINLNMFQDIFEVGSQLFIWQYGAGQITVVEGTNVTVHTPETLTFNEQYASISMVQVFPNEWMIAGRMTPA